MRKRSFTRHGFALFDEADLRDLVEEAGFFAVTVEVLGDSIFTTASALDETPASKSSHDQKRSTHP
jgi:hypothetical protein